MSAAAITAPVSDSPWRFLDALGFDSEADRELLSRTRGAELQILTNLVRSSKASVLYAYSGNGKSSLVNAGLIPNLVAADYVVFRTRPRPPFATESPTHAFKEGMLRDLWLPEVDPQDQTLPQELLRELPHVDGPAGERLIELLERLAPQWGRISTPSSLRSAYIEYIRPKIDSPLHEFIAATQRFFGTQTYLIFICDQFEELFVHYLNQPALQSFIGEVAKVISDDSIHAQFLFSMREDWVGSMLELRRQIPELLLNMYQLPPIRKSAASPVLEYPLERSNTGLKFEAGVVDRILADLSQFYSVLQRRQQYTDIRLSRSPETDPYLELPALQVVAEKLWQTRNHTGGFVPFSLKHYEELPNLLAPTGQPPPQAESVEEQEAAQSPARRVLEGYLGEILARIATTAERREFQIDILYALTDGGAHRKALPQDDLLNECRRSRSDALYSLVTEDELKQALNPLIGARLVRTAQGRGGKPEYELAHDFLVRSVAALWKDLDRQRAARRALAMQARDELESFRKSRRRLLVSMIWLPLVVLAAVLLSGVAADQERRAAGDEPVLRTESDAEALLHDLDYHDTLLSRLRAGPWNGVIQDYARRDNVSLDTLEQRDGLATWLLNRFRAATILNLMGIQFPSPLTNYAWFLVAPLIVGILLWFVAGTADNRAGQVTGILAAAGCVAIGLASTLSGWNWDGQWGWRTLLALVLVPLWVDTSGLASIKLWPGHTLTRQLRTFSAWCVEFVLMYIIVGMPLLADERLGFWPKGDVPFFVGIGVWSMVQVAITTRTGSTLGCLLVGLRMVRKHKASNVTEPVAMWRMLVREAVRWVELLGIGISMVVLADKNSDSFARKSSFGEDFTMTVLIFCAVLITSVVVTLFLKRPLADRIAGIDYTAESVTKPDYSALRTLSSRSRITAHPIEQPSS